MKNELDMVVKSVSRAQLLVVTQLVMKRFRRSETEDAVKYLEDAVKRLKALVARSGTAR